VGLRVGVKKLIYKIRFRKL